MASEAMIETYQANLMLMEQKNDQVVQVCRTKLMMLEQTRQETAHLIEAYRAKLMPLEQQNDAQLHVSHQESDNLFSEAFQLPDRGWHHRGHTQQRTTDPRSTSKSLAPYLGPSDTRWTRRKRSVSPTRDSSPHSSSLREGSSDHTQSAVSRPISTEDLGNVSAAKLTPNLTSQWYPATRYPGLEPAGIATIRSFLGNPSPNADLDPTITTAAHKPPGDVDLTIDVDQYSEAAPWHDLNAITIPQFPNRGSISSAHHPSAGTYAQSVANASRDC
ncbi:hypothetical protein LTR95_016159 [Oleoguttula sp. CCFEE 5521]